MRVYLDACCVNRPFDDQTQDRIRLEAEAVLLVLGHVQSGQWQWVGSKILDYEIAHNPDLERRLRTELLLRLSQPGAQVTHDIERRASALTELGLGAVDALHVAIAEVSEVDVLLTTDDRLLGLYRRHSASIRVSIASPLSWLREVSEK